MSTTVLSPNSNEEIIELMNTKFKPKLKTDNDSIYFTLSNNIINIQNNNNVLTNEKNTLNKMSFLFPSIPIEVSKKLFNFIFVESRKYFQIQKYINRRRNQTNERINPI